jgi:hypothetical protein
MSRARTVTTAGAVYVAAWLAGLAVAPAAPGLDAPDAAIAAHYAVHGGATAVQSLLVHGLAGVALIAFTLALSTRPWARRAGAGAGAVSLLQAAIGLGLSTGAIVDAASGVDVSNLADTLKLVLVACFIVAAAPDVERRLRRAAPGVAGLQVVGGAAFVAGSQALYALLYIALPVLLAWVAAAAWSRRGAAATSRGAWRLRPGPR